MCTICGECWNNQKSADDCEALHAPLSSFSIKGINFIPYTIQTRYLKIWPKSIYIVNSQADVDDKFNVATYELKQIGHNDI
jgi:hypothetical protein